MENGQSLQGMEKLPKTAKHPPVTVSMFSLNAILYTTFSVYKTANHSPRKMYFPDISLMPILQCLL